MESICSFESIIMRNKLQIRYPIAPTQPSIKYDRHRHSTTKIPNPVIREYRPANFFSGKKNLDTPHLQSIRRKAATFEVKEKNIEEEKATVRKLAELARRSSAAIKDKQIVALASSTGGPKALQEVVPKLPGNLKCPMVIVQHMPAGFTASLAERLNTLSECAVSEAKDGEVLEDGHVYIAMGGKHLNIDSAGGKYKVRYSDEPTREGVKPCANYMYESLSNSIADRVVCVVLTGMGADGTKGIENLKQNKKIYVIAQDENSSTVYGMPKSVKNAGLTNTVVPLSQVAQEIIMNVGVN